MSDPRVLRYRVSRTAGRFITRVAALLTLGAMPPFVSASAIVPLEDDILVVVDPVRREPTLPGGHLKWSEDPRSAVIREVREETGYVVEPGPLLGVYAGRRWAGENGVVRIIYSAALRGGRLTSSGEGDPAWVPVREMAASETRDAEIIRIWLQQRGAP